jgi:uracil-DNA glycosylase family 4
VAAEAASAAAPGRDCPFCPRLAAFREENRQRLPQCHNAPVPSFGGLDARLLVVGLAPGLKGANCSGRPFTGDYAGDLLYATLLKVGLAGGSYGRHAGDALRLEGVRITNAVRCVPPQNKPEPVEIRTCNAFLAAEIAVMPELKAVLALGAIAHGAVLTALGLRKSHAAFRHGALHRLPTGLTLADSYHCSRYNTNTNRLTTAMFEAVVTEVAALVHEARLPGGAGTA